jgi:hypothetical protein
MKTIFKSKTFWTGMAGIAAAGTGYAGGDFTSAEAVQTALTGLIGIFLRMGLERRA